MPAQAECTDDGPQLASVTLDGGSGRLDRGWAPERLAPARPRPRGPMTQEGPPGRGRGPHDARRGAAPGDPGPGPAGWPRSASFPAEAAAVTMARLFVRAGLVGIDPERAADIEVVASELAANAVLHARSPFGVTLDRSRRELRVLVQDGGTGWPTPRAAQPLDRVGRGLQMVDSLATRWGVERAGSGKVVWAEFALGGSLPRPPAGRRRGGSDGPGPPPPGVD